jgi:hypothetical protein
MSLKQARLIDPVLSKHAQGYANAEFVGMALFPTVPVTASGGQILEFGREAFVRYAARRAPGGAVKRVPMGYFGRPFHLVCEALDAEVPRELARDAQEVADVDLSMRAVNVVMRALALGLEIDQATIARDATNYPTANKITLSGTSQWSDATNSDPLGDIDTGMEAIRRATGMYPNVMVIPSAVYRVARSHPSVRDAFGGTTAGSLGVDQLARAFDIPRVVVAGAVSASTAAPIGGPAPDDVFSDVWGKDVILAYAPEKPSGLEEPSYGYTYTMQGNPFVEQARWDGDTRSWVHGVTYERVPVLSGISAGYLIKNAIA